MEKDIQGPSIKYAFCNDKWRGARVPGERTESRERPVIRRLILSSSGEGGVFEPSLNGVPSPPGADIGGVLHCTGDETRTVDRYYGLQYPLDVVNYAEGVHTNNVDLFDGTAGNSPVTYAYDDGTGLSPASLFPGRRHRQWEYTQASGRTACPTARASASASTACRTG